MLVFFVNVTPNAESMITATITSAGYSIDVRPEDDDVDVDAAALVEVAGPLVVGPVVTVLVVETPAGVVLLLEVEETPEELVGVSASQAVMLGTSASPSSKWPVTGFGQFVQ